MTFLTTSFLWLLLGIPVVILLHFLRTKRQEKQVSAIFLWQEAKNLVKQRRRFTSTWLLLLQILLIALLAFALAKPRLTVKALDRVFIIDASASMTTQSSEGQRLARAIIEAERLLKGTGQVALVRVGLDATVVQELTNDHFKLRQALLNLKAADRSADISRGVDLAKSIAPQAELHLFSDSLPQKLEVNFHPITDDAQNIGITNFELRGNQAFVAVLSTSNRPHEVTLNILHKDKIIAQSNLLVPAQNQTHVSLPIEGEEGVYHAYLEVLEWDGLKLDNEVFLEHKQLRVLISPPETFIERALSAIPNLKVRASGRVNGVYDVLVTSNNLPADLQSLEAGKYFFYAKGNSNPSQTIVDWDSTHPLLRFVDLTGTNVNPTNFKPEGDWQILARTEDLNPVILYANRDETTVIALNFHPSQGNLRRRNAFPIFMANVMREFEQDKQLPLGTPLSAENVLFNGNSTETKRAYETGIYNLDGVNYSVNLLSTTESRLASIDPNPVEGKLNQNAFTENEWPLEFWLLVFALGFLVLEWLWWSKL